MRLSHDQLVFLARFSKSPDSRPWLELLEARLAECEAKLRTSIGEAVYREQGCALVLDELIAHITKAPSELNRAMATATTRSAMAREQGTRV